MLDFLEINWQTHSLKPEQHFPLPMFPAHWPRPLQRLGIFATLFEDKIFLSHNTLSCQIPTVSSKELALPVSSAVNCPDFAVTVAAFSCPLAG